MTIYKKLADVKTKIGKLSKDTANPFFKSKYADINQLIEITDPVLLEAGLMVIQPIIDGHLTTKIIDVETGESIDSALKLPELNDAQKIGSAITYFRRYTLKSLLNIQEEDDDANKAVGNNTQKQNSQPSKPMTSSKPVAKIELYPGILDKWNSAKEFIKGYDGIVFDAVDKIKEKYTLSPENEELLLEEAKGIKSDKTDVPQETIDAIKAAKSSEELTGIYNDCSALHVSKKFIELIESRRKEILLPGKKKAA